MLGAACQASRILRESNSHHNRDVLKNIVQPALVLDSLRWVGYGSPIVSEAVLTTAIPSMPIVIMLALQYRIAQTEAASAVFLSVMGSMITVFIALTR